MPRRIFVIGVRSLAATAFCCASTLIALSQDIWPDRIVTMVVNFQAGSASDLLARSLIGPLRQELGQPFVIENRGGADGVIAGRDVARASPTGYTVGFGTTTAWALQMNLYPKEMGFDPRTDFAPVSLLGTTHYLLIANADLGINSVAELVQLARRSKAGYLNYSSTGEGSISHLGMLILAKKLGIEMTHVPYKSTAQSIVDVASGIIQLQLASIAPTIPLYQAGKVRILGIAGDHRSPLLPDVPTLAEQGVDTHASFSQGLVFPAGTSERIVKRLNEAVSQTLKDPKVREAFFQQGVDPQSSTPSELAQDIEAEFEEYKAILSEFNISVH
jgi:tripartite-type tricarboxylate transporter receptor subunit TctC